MFHLVDRESRTVAAAETILRSEACCDGAVRVQVQRWSSDAAGMAQWWCSDGAVIVQ